MHIHRRKHGILVDSKDAIRVSPSGERSSWELSIFLLPAFYNRDKHALPIIPTLMTNWTRGLCSSCQPKIPVLEPPALLSKFESGEVGSNIRVRAKASFPFLWAPNNEPQFSSSQFWPFQEETISKAVLDLRGENLRFVSCSDLGQLFT